MPSITNLLIPTYKQNLKSLSAWLDKAATDDMLSRRLAKDMFPLATQVRFICYQSQEAVFRIQGKEIPPNVTELTQEGRNFNDEANKDTLANGKARIEEALEFLESLEPDALDADGNAERKLTLEIPGPAGPMQFDLTGEQFARDWALPQFYFHTVVAYSILRNAGVELGKADYVPHMFVYMRPPPAPESKEAEE